jgi:hypothetical protein
VHGAAKALAARLATPTKPLLLVQPGPIARYGLTEFLRELARAGANRDAAATFLLVPMHDTGGAPRIDGTMVIPGVLPGQTMWMSRAWLDHHLNVPTAV